MKVIESKNFGAPLQHQPERRYRPNGTTHISPCQADNLWEAARFARELGTPLIAHATINWSLTDAGEDTDGKRFAAVRECFSKVLSRKDIPFRANWVREKPFDGQHAHMVFWLPYKYWDGDKAAAWVQDALERLVARHAGSADAYTVRIKRQNGSPGYFLKGGTPEVWKKYSVLKKWRKPQGVIFGKRCGVTQSISCAVRARAQDEGTTIPLAAS